MLCYKSIEPACTLCMPTLSLPSFTKLMFSWHDLFWSDTQWLFVLFNCSLLQAESFCYPLTSSFSVCVREPVKWCGLFFLIIRRATYILFLYFDQKSKIRTCHSQNVLKILGYACLIPEDSLLWSWFHLFFHYIMLITIFLKCRCIYKFWRTAVLRFFLVS